MNKNQEIKDLIKSIKTHRLVRKINYWFTSGTSNHIVKYVIPIESVKKQFKFKKILVSLFFIFNIFTIYKSKYNVPRHKSSQKYFLS
jgi:hypothetical protein